MHKLTKVLSTNPNPASILEATPHSFRAQSQREKHPSGAPLGKSTESASRNEKPLKVRLNQYNLLRKAKALARWDERCQICQTVRKDFTDSPGIVEIRQSGVSGKHSFGNLYCCGNVWTCAVCAVRTSRQRGAEIKLAMEMHHLSGGKCYLATYTIQHRSYSHLGFTLNALREASRAFKSGRWYQYAKANIVGTISGLETTWGKQNGWHPHTHEVIFVDGVLEEWEIRSWKRHWMLMVERQGLYVSFDIGLDIREADPSDYNCKFGADFEVTGDMQKDGGGLSQWQILSMSDELQYAALWIEYVEQFKGRRRITWTKGLKHHFGIDENEEREEPAEVVATLTQEKYKIIHENGWEREFLLSLDTIGFDDTHALFFDDFNYYRKFRLDRAGGG